MTHMGLHAKKKKRLLPDWLFMALVIVLATTLMGMLGQFDGIDQQLADDRAANAPRNASQQTYILAIDQSSVSKIGGYPLPREVMAKALSKLEKSDVSRIYLDVMFGYHGKPEQDKKLLDAMKKLGPERLALPKLEKRAKSKGAAQNQKTNNRSSLSVFAQATSEVAANMVLGRDKLVRWLGYPDTGILENSEPNAAYWLAGAQYIPSRSVAIDYAIKPSSIPVISFSDFLEPDFDLKLLREKTVILGITVQGIVQPTFVPIHGYSSRPHIFALATETILQNRHVTALSAFQTVLVSLVLTIVLAFLIRQLSALTGLVILVAVIIGLNVLAGIARAEYLLEIPTAGPVFALLMLSVLHIFSTLSIFERHRQTLGRLLDRVSFGHLHLFEHGEDAILTFAPNGDILSFNASAEALFQVRAEKVIGRPISTILPNKTVSILTTSAEQKSGRLQTRLDDETGNLRHLDLSYSAMSMNDDWLGLVSIRDITDFKNREAELAHAATHDTLTGLANRAGLEKQYQKVLKQFHQDHQRFGLMMFDLDKFKIINDTHGHHVGDCVLKLVSDRIRYVLREQDFAARLGGDEFAIILRSDISQNDAAEIADRLRERISQPMRIEGLKLSVGVSIGIALSTQQNHSMKEMMHAADMALYQVKNAGRNGYAFSEAEAHHPAQ